MLILFIGNVWGVTLSLLSETSPHTGIVIQSYRASNPNTDVTVALVDLCVSGIHVDATHIDNASQNTSSWANSMGVQLAMNGDFYKSGPMRVYGDAVGSGIPWPIANTGVDSAYSSEWYFGKYGWIAFGHDWVDYTYTEWVKNNPSSFSTAVGGWMPTTTSPPQRTGTIALVSGFPTLVMEGEVYTCSSPTDGSCFPDRTDMRSRHPRSAVGLSSDFQTLMLVAVDGRTSSNAGMYGAELAETMGLLNAHFALNVDGGGSTQLWQNGYINSPSEPSRAVANHLGIFAGTNSGKSTRAGHCISEPPCQLIPPEGGIIDDSSSCFTTFGPPIYWRSETQGYNNHLYWTNAWQHAVPSNWAWWQINVEEAGEYEVSYYATPQYAVHTEVPYVIHANGQEHNLIVDQTGANGWTSLGTFDFTAGGDQFVALYDNNSNSVPASQHIVADAIQITRVGEWCGDGICSIDEDCSCDDCVLPEEIPDNNIDDDCDGVIDTPSEPTSEPVDTSLPECSESEIWCIDEFTLGICNTDTYSEINCAEEGFVCSDQLLQCVSLECLDREEESWCIDNTAIQCSNGIGNIENCETLNLECVNGECTDIENNEDKDEIDDLDTKPIENESGCFGGGSALLFMLPLFMIRRRRR